mmetsp:Transcript_28101/g.66715  ORF Transcript_28101/g.66715 Transcript_28101/m.66715 type:complete len:139 (+) Transcript_28101:693-1109(+)
MWTYPSLSPQVLTAAAVLISSMFMWYVSRCTTTLSAPTSEMKSIAVVLLVESPTKRLPRCLGVPLCRSVDEVGLVPVYHLHAEGDAAVGSGSSSLADRPHGVGAGLCGCRSAVLLQGTIEDPTDIARAHRVCDLDRVQ